MRSTIFQCSVVLFAAVTTALVVTSAADKECDKNTQNTNPYNNTPDDQPSYGGVKRPSISPNQTGTIPDYLHNPSNDDAPSYGVTKLNPKPATTTTTTQTSSTAVSKHCRETKVQHIVTFLQSKGDFTSLQAVVMKSVQHFKKCILSVQSNTTTTQVRRDALGRILISVAKTITSTVMTQKVVTNAITTLVNGSKSWRNDDGVFFLVLQKICVFQRTTSLNNSRHTRSVQTGSQGRANAVYDEELE